MASIYHSLLCYPYSTKSTMDSSALWVSKSTFLCPEHSSLYLSSLVGSRPLALYSFLNGLGKGWRVPVKCSWFGGVSLRCFAHLWLGEGSQRQHLLDLQLVDLQLVD